MAVVSSNLQETRDKVPPFKSFMRSFILLLDSWRILYVLSYPSLSISVQTYDPRNPSGINIPSRVSGSLGADESRRGEKRRVLTALQNKCSSTASRASGSSFLLSATELWIRVCRELIRINTANIYRATLKCRSFGIDSALWKIKIGCLPSKCFPRYISGDIYFLSILWTDVSYSKYVLREPEKENLARESNEHAFWRWY